MQEAHESWNDPGLARALDVLRSADSYLLAGHVRPDGDCIGAQAAMASVLTSLGKRVRILNTDPPQSQFDYLAQALRYEVYSGGDIPAHDVLVLLDFSELSRLGPLCEPLSRAPSKKVVVDHHLHEGEAWWDAAYLDSGASATGLLVHRIARALDAKIDAVAALGIFTSIVTDTGWFKYSNTDAETLRVAGEMISLGVDPSSIYSAIYQRATSDQPLAIGRLLDRLEYFAGGRLAVVDLPLQGPDDPELEDGDEVLDILRSVEKVEVVLFLRALRDGTVKLSARSKADYDVNRLARQFGGGGHAKASGATLSGPLAEARTLLVAAAEAGFEETGFEANGAGGPAKDEV